MDTTESMSPFRKYNKWDKSTQSYKRCEKKDGRSKTANNASVIQRVWRGRQGRKDAEWKRKLSSDGVILADCIEGMSHIDSESTDIVLIDPPYNIGKDFGNDSDKQKMGDYLEFCDKWMTEGFRILKPTGTLYIYGFSEILAFIRVRIDLSYHVRWLVWHYTNKNSPTAKFWNRSHESIICCSKMKTPHFNLDDVRVPYTDGFVNGAAGKVRNSTKGRFSKGDKTTTYTAHPQGAMPRDVIKVPTLAGGGKERVKGHPTQKPLAICDTLLKAALNKNGDTRVVVPFAGSGSECVSAKRLKLHYVGFELNEDYVEICKGRLDAC